MVTIMDFNIGDYVCHNYMDMLISFGQTVENNKAESLKAGETYSAFKNFCTTASIRPFLRFLEWTNVEQNFGHENFTKKLKNDPIEAIGPKFLNALYENVEGEIYDVAVNGLCPIPVEQGRDVCC